MKIGLFFGSFNPIHIGHTAIANCMVEKGGIDRLWFVVSPQNPFKDKEDLLSDKIRLQMVNLAIDYDNRFEACDIELNMPLPSFTINTLNCLQTKYPDNEFLLIMGADNFVNLPKWKDYETLITNYRFLIYPRPECNPENIVLKGNFTFIDAPMLKISSTQIRRDIADNKDVSQFLSPKVNNLIIHNLLYR
jgi:nicotinate-nucleotide adenylyltransferase